MQKNLSLFLLSILLFITSCSQDDFVENNLIEQKAETSSGFYSFSKNSTLQSKNGNPDFSTATKYSYLLQRYDSLHKTNISGLVNTANNVEYNHKLKQNFIVEANSFYIETRIFSQVIEEENGDRRVVFPRIKDNKVEGLLVGLLSKNKTDLRFYIYNQETNLFKEFSPLFQSKYNQFFNNSLQAKTRNGLCGYGSEVCELDGVVVRPNPGDGNPGGGWREGGSDSGGGGCREYEDCDNSHNEEGGGSETPPSCKSFDFKKVGTANFQEAGVKNIGTYFIARAPSGRNVTLGVYIGELYFGLPVNKANGEFYSTSKASQISAKVLDKAFKSTENYFKSNLGASKYNLETHLMNSLRAEMKKYGGTISKTPSDGAGYKPNLKDFKNYWFFDVPSCWN